MPKFYVRDMDFDDEDAICYVAASTVDAATMWADDFMDAVNDFAEVLVTNDDGLEEVFEIEYVEGKAEVIS